MDARAQPSKTPHGLYFGYVDGYVFKLGTEGLGYYKEKRFELNALIPIEPSASSEQQQREHATGAARDN